MGKNFVTVAVYRYQQVLVILKSNGEYKYE
ncbi:MAG: hypothetical protein JWP81_2773 [Ferruginibacter sp.]|nr:hypothetical protein [Ferruginibacter sp.]